MDMHIEFLEGFRIVKQTAGLFTNPVSVFSFLRNNIIENLNGLKKMAVGRIEQKERNINESLKALRQITQ